MLRTTFRISDGRASRHAAGTLWQQSTPILMVDKDYSHLDSADGPTFGCSFQSFGDRHRRWFEWLNDSSAAPWQQTGEIKDRVRWCVGVLWEHWCLAGKMWIVFTPESKTGKLRLAFERDTSTETLAVHPFKHHPNFLYERLSVWKSLH